MQTEVQTKPEERIIEYHDESGQLFYMIHKPRNNSLTLRVQINNSCMVNQNILINEIVRLIMTKDSIVVLGNSGFTFTFQGGFPAWSPYALQDNDSSFACNIFATGYIDSNQNIFATGVSEPDYHRYPLAYKKQIPLEIIKK